jgi:predicted amidohydrolase
MQLVPTDHWAVAGEKLTTIDIPLGDGGESLKAGIIICHDSRYPELVRLLVLNGARCIFYLSWETWFNDEPVPLTERELGPYRAQVQARAVENRVFVVHSNVPSNPADRALGSHGMSRIVDPLGRVMQEAGVEGDELLVQEIDLEDANALYAQKSLLPSYLLRDWWAEGAARVK